MHPLVYFDGKIVPLEEARIPAVSDAVFYGNSIFTTIAIRGGEPVLLDRHLERLTASGEDLFGIDVDQMTNAVTELIDANRVINGRLRITLLKDDTVSIEKKSELSTEATILITSSESRSPKTEASLLLDGPSHFIHKPIVKCGNYIDHVNANRSAKMVGFDETVLINSQSRDLVSASFANIFFLKGNELCTPHRNVGCLKGTVRAEIIESVEVNEIYCSPDELKNSDYVFLTSSGLGICPVTQLDEKQLPPFPLTPELQRIADLFEFK